MSNKPVPAITIHITTITAILYLIIATGPANAQTNSPVNTSDIIEQIEKARTVTYLKTTLIDPNSIKPIIINPDPNSAKKAKTDSNAPSGKLACKGGRCKSGTCGGIKPGEKYEVKGMALHTGCQREDSPGNRTLLINPLQRTSMTLDTKNKKAHIVKMTTKTKSTKGFFCLPWGQEIKDTINNGQYTKTEKIQDKTTWVFSQKKPYQTNTVWIDTFSSLPVKLKTVTRPGKGENKPFHIILKSGDFGLDSRSVRVFAASSGSSPNCKSTTEYTFQWNLPLDESLFDMTPPADYEVKKITSSPPDPLALLKLYADTSDGQLPAKTVDLLDSEKMTSSLIKKFKKGKDPKSELEQACEKAKQLTSAFTFIKECQENKKWFYAADKVSLGDKSKPLCWWKEPDSEKWNIIYGDLTTKQSDNPPETENF